MERHFEKDLNELKDRLLWMGSLAERAVHQALHGVLDSDEQRICALCWRFHESTTISNGLATRR